MAEKPTYVYDALGDFSKGVNSGLDPFIVPRDQLCFGTNTTVRGNFVTCRPAHQSLSLVGNPTLVAAATGSLFQGSTYYSPDSGQQYLIAQIGGRLFTFTPDVGDNNVALSEISIPNDYNPVNIPQAWLEQAENFVVVQNGLSLPVIFDGSVSRRSIPNATVLAITTSAQFSPPPIGGTVQVNISPAYTGPLNISVVLQEYDTSTPANVVATSTYFIKSTGAGATLYTVTLNNVSDTVGTIHNAGSALIVQPNNLGTVKSCSAAYGPPTIETIILYTPVPSYVVVGSQVQILSGPNRDKPVVWDITSITADRLTLGLQLHDQSSVYYITNLGAPNNPITLLNSALPNLTVGTLSAPFTSVAQGQLQTGIKLTSAFNYAVGSIVFIDGSQFIVTDPKTTPGSTTLLVLENLDDGRGSTYQFNSSGFGLTQIWSIPEIPAGRMMSYGMGRIWTALPDGQSFIAGDIVDGVSGSPSYNYRDAVIKLYENTFLSGGGSFRVPSNRGQITGMQFTSQLDASLGQGALMVVTPGGIFSCNTPTDRSTWQSLTNPILSESLIGLGGLGQSSTICVNGDLLFRAVDGIRSLIMARREFWSWGNTPISFEMKRVLDADSPAFLPFASAVQFDNRLLMTAQPAQSSLGVYFQGLVALNFDSVSSIQGKGPSVYDGLWTGLNVLQIVEGMFSGVHRCFAFCLSSDLSAIQLVELLKSTGPDNGTTPITWSFETPMMFRQAQGKTFFDLCSIADGEFYLSGLDPELTYHAKIEYRSDFSQDWLEWIEYDFMAKNGPRLGLGAPSISDTDTDNNTVASVGRWFQFRFSLTGQCVYKGCKIAASVTPQSQFAPIPTNEQ